MYGCCDYKNCFSHLIAWVFIIVDHIFASMTSSMSWCANVSVQVRMNKQSEIFSAQCIIDCQAHNPNLFRDFCVLRLAQKQSRRCSFHRANKMDVDLTQHRLKVNNFQCGYRVLWRFKLNLFRKRCLPFVDGDLRLLDIARPWDCENFWSLCVYNLFRFAWRGGVSRVLEILIVDWRYDAQTMQESNWSHAAIVQLSGSSTFFSSQHMWKVSCTEWERNVFGFVGCWGVRERERLVLILCCICFDTFGSIRVKTLFLITGRSSMTTNHCTLMMKAKVISHHETAQSMFSRKTFC